MCVSQQPELRWIPVGLWVLAACAGRSTRSKQGFPTNNWPLAPCQGCSKAGQGRATFEKRVLGLDAGQGQGGQGRAGQGRPGTPQTPRTDQKDFNSEGFGVLLCCLTAERSMAGLRHYSPCNENREVLPSLAVPSDARLEPRAPMQMVSGALGSLGFGVYGLGFRALITGPYRAFRANLTVFDLYLLMKPPIIALRALNTSPGT